MRRDRCTRSKRLGCTQRCTTISARVARRVAAYSFFSEICRKSPEKSCRRGWRTRRFSHVPARSPLRAFMVAESFSSVRYEWWSVMGRCSGSWSRNQRLTTGCLTHKSFVVFRILPRVIRMTCQTRVKHLLVPVWSCLEMSGWGVPTNIQSIQSTHRPVLFGPGSPKTGGLRPVVGSVSEACAVYALVASVSGSSHLMWTIDS